MVNQLKPKLTDSELVIGLDEVGRGCLAGPVVVAAVLAPRFSPPLPKDIVVQDSKTVSKLRRQPAQAWLCTHYPYGLGQVSAAIIDKIGIAAAVKQAAQIAFHQLSCASTQPLPEYPIIVDGNVSWLEGDQPQIKADARIFAVMAASIIAKVHRDALMAELDWQYPEWRFSQHVGYGTLHHRHQILKNGLIHGLHRAYFCTKVLKTGAVPTTQSV